MNISFLKAFGAQRKLTRDGQPAKRRGPKPDSKPAQTRRQELNRQAQRTHRERKEQYIRALESEISRLREAYSQDIIASQTMVQQHREALQSLREENDIMKEILRSHGIPFEGELERRRVELHSADPSSSFAGSSSGSAILQNSHPHALSTPPTTVSSGMSPGASNGGDFMDTSHGSGRAYHYSPCEQPGLMEHSGRFNNASVPTEAPGIFEKDPQLGIDFILTLEAPCRDHTEYLCRKSSNASDEDEDAPFSGHALMASCPPPSHIDNKPEGQMYPHQTYNLPPANLATLLNLSRQLVTEGQITPIMALQSLKDHELYHTLTRDDIKIIMETLHTKIRCYGFGAVIEDFELMDCLSSVLGSKIDSALAHGHGKDDMMYT
ncbi:hypothetical protein VTN02DRAFT_3658 [Thermoascus thermophilus]